MNKKIKKLLNIFIPKKGDVKQVLIQKITLLTACVCAVGGVTGFTIWACVNNNSKPVDVSVSSYTPTGKNWGTIGDTESGLNELVASILASDAAVSEAKAQSDKAESDRIASEKASNEAVSGATVSVTSKPTEPKPQPNKQMPEGYLPDFQKWYNVNTDIRGYLKIPNTNVNYPVMQGKNNTFYLDHNEYKSHYVWGIPYMDYRVQINKDWTSSNIMLYGHGDDKRGLMLSHMKKYRDVNFYKTHPVIEFNTVYEKSQWKVITLFIENAATGSFDFWNRIQFNNETEFNDYVDNARARGYFSSSVDAQYGDQLLSIQVCENTNTSNYNRLVLVARKLRRGEDAAVDTSAAAQLK